MNPNRPAPESDAISRPYWEAANDGKLMLPRCGSCGSVFFPPRPWCSECGSQKVDWVQSRGLGKIVSYSKLYIEPFEGYAGSFPYVVAVVRLEEGPQLLTNIVDCDPESVSVDASVKVVFEERVGGAKVPQFTLDVGGPRRTTS